MLVHPIAFMIVRNASKPPACFAARQSRRNRARSRSAAFFDVIPSAMTYPPPSNIINITQYLCRVQLCCFLSLGPSPATVRILAHSADSIVGVKFVPSVCRCVHAYSFRVCLSVRIRRSLVLCSQYRHDSLSFIHFATRKPHNNGMNTEPRIGCFRSGGSTHAARLCLALGGSALYRLTAIGTHPAV